MGDSEKEKGNEGEEDFDIEEEDESQESEGSMTIGNTVMDPLEEVNEEEVSEEPRPSLTPVVGDGELKIMRMTCDYLKWERTKRKDPAKPTRTTSRQRRKWLLLLELLSPGARERLLMHN